MLVFPRSSTTEPLASPAENPCVYPRQGQSADRQDEYESHR